jgi:hypothetical protein
LNYDKILLAIKEEFPTYHIDVYDIIAKINQSENKQKELKEFNLQRVEGAMYHIAINGKYSRDRIEAAKFLLTNQGTKLGYKQEPNLMVNITNNLPNWAVGELPKIETNDDDTPKI